MRWKTSWLLLVILIILDAALIYRLWDKASAEDGLHRKLVELLTQFGLVVIVGGTVAAWWKYYWEEAARERERLRQVSVERGIIYREFMAKVGAAYREAKSIRRVLRAAGLRLKTAPRSTIVTGRRMELYKDQMFRLNQAQLQLEGLKLEAKYHPELRERLDIHAHLKDMEQYLGSLIREYEGVGEEFPLADLRYLDEFTDDSNAKGKAVTRRFEANFASAYGEVVLLLGDLLETVDEGRRTQGLKRTPDGAS